MSKKLKKKTPIEVKIVSQLEVGRAARKLQLEKDGEIEVTSASASTLREFALGFEEPYKKKQSNAAVKSVAKRREIKATRDARILVRFDELSSTKQRRDISSLIAKEIGLHRDTVTKIIRKQLKSR